ncbi:RNA polymerase sigma factor [Neobacillus sp. 179-C4.2 HS]|uniref:RNA polymerase sigma factor n=1 Tax=Neobacillus driksii TaxID=3035913 RepID=A0ABV4YRD7_9BACI|nr:RNA polymerase sigma factor [Neobacillus sp. 179.-C4.2 HS]MDP5194993.1 RNA polymerase sigma factor [Neobacillus sp. 179.-C4.2 HS]
MNGQDEYIHTLYEEYFDDVYHYLLYFTNSKTDAEDLTQDTFIKVLKNYDSFRQESSMKTWILSIARRTAIDHYRRKKLISILPSILSDISKSKDFFPEAEMDHCEDWAILQKALLTLKPDYRNVVILRGLKEFSIKETAEVLNWKESKVKTDYHRAIKLLKESLSKSNEGVVIFNEQRSAR